MTRHSYASMARSWRALACPVVVVLFFLVVLPTTSADVHGRDTGASTRIHLDKIAVARDGDVRMSVWPGELKRSGEWVTVSWSGASTNRGDWVGVYSPADADVTTTAPIKYKYADEFPGSGKLEFRLTNMRADYIFHYFSGGIRKPTLIASSDRVTFANYNEPLQGRLMLTGVPHEMRVMWTTNNATTPLVKFGTSPGKYVSSVSGSTTTYTRDQMCGAPANTEGWRDPGLLHSAILSGLSPDTRYYYVYGDPAYGFSEEASFMSAPLPGAASRTLNIFAYGDMGKTTQDGSLEHWNNEQASINTTRLMIKDLQSMPMDLAIHIGDISYAVGYSAQWDEFHDQVLPIATRLPYMTCIGNHERDFPNSGSRFNGTDSGGECGLPYEVRYPMPTPGRDQPWYSFDYGSVHFIFMSSEHNFTIGGAQWQWIEADLRKVDRTKTPWLIFSGHRPMYIDSNYDKGDAADQPVARELRSNLEALLFKYRVDLAFWGHHHSYQRSCPVFNGTCMAEGQATTHVVIGMAGYRLSTDIPVTMPSWARVVDVSENGYTRLSVTPSRLEMTFISDVDASVKDHFVLTK